VAKTSFKRLVDLKNNLSDKGFSEDSIDIISASWRESTIKQYQYAWKLWSNWCISHSIDPINSSVQDLLNFLSVQFKLVKSYSILNTYRSSFSSIHCNVDNVPVGQHRFFKGLANLKPSLPRYSVTWDVDKVFSFLESLWKLEDLSLKMLACRTVVLVALITAQRTQTIQFLDIFNVTQDSNGITFYLNKLTKTDKPEKFRSVFIPVFTDNEKLCVVKTLNMYISRTKSIRKSKQLFVSFRKPHKAVSSSTLAKWMLIILELSGIDCTIFRAHSFRAAASSKLHSKGFSVKELVNCGLWKDGNTFLKFYLRNIKMNSDKKVSSARMTNLLLSK
jgi:hypothetical protein